MGRLLPFPVSEFRSPLSFLTDSLITHSATLLAIALAMAVLLRERRSVPAWAFFAGMLVLALESWLGGMSLRADSGEAYLRWQKLAFAAKALLPLPWLIFSLTYSRGNPREFLRRWALLLLVAGLVPVGLVFGPPGDLLYGLPDQSSNAAEAAEAGILVFSLAGKIVNVLLLLSAVLILTNLERTFRSAVGTMQWRIKYMILGVGVIFAARIYTRSQSLLFSAQNSDAIATEAAAVLVGGVLIIVAFLRSGFGSVEVYPSRAVLQSSLTFLLVGAYLFVVGVLAQVVAAIGGATNFQVQALLVLVGIVILTMLLLSRRVRRAMQLLVSRHFHRPQHDACGVWTRLTQSLARMPDERALCAAAIKLISETFSVLSVTFWLVEEQSERLTRTASTAEPEAETDAPPGLAGTEAFRGAMMSARGPFDLEDAKGEWAEALRNANAPQFQHGGRQLAIPLRAGDRWLGVAVLADRVNGVPYAAEELDLLRCIGDQVAASLLNFRLGSALMSARELEAFQTMSTFFVHDLKNATGGLNLMLKNLPIHFDDPEFRADALRGIGNTVNRIDSLISRLSTLRNKLELKLADCDLNVVVEEALGNVHGMSDIHVVTEREALPVIIADREQVESVVTNLVLNARDALNGRGEIRVQTALADDRAVLTVSDNGCGMTPEFVRKSLFRPFQTTKKKGIGIGMFQSRMIVEAHHGTMSVESTPGKGTTFKVALPLKPQS